MLEIIITTVVFLGIGAVLGTAYALVQKRGSDRAANVSDSCSDKNKSPMQAVILCSGTIDENIPVYRYTGVKDCRAAMSLGNGGRMCTDGCIGYGSCVKACPEKAIAVRKGLAAVDVTACTGCGECLASCPLNLIVLRPRDFRTGRNCVRNCPGGICGACGTETADFN